MKKLGITLRLSRPQGYSEPRDSLARDWYRWLEQMEASFDWFLLPNLGDDSVAYARAQQLGGLILTGGESIGVDPVRDASELALLEYCVQNNLPVLGICRGLQLIYHYFGGNLIQTDASQHIAQRHFVQLQDPLPWAVTSSITLDVNSYHQLALATPIPEVLHPLAFDEWGNCEAIRHCSQKIAGIMWHPEREGQVSKFDRHLYNWLFH